MKKRILKFRAWHAGMNQMFTAEQMTKDQLTLLPTGQFINVSGTHTSLSLIYPSEVMKPIEFTGLYDKNDQEIYDGDIVEYYGNEDEGGIIITKHEVFFQEASFCILDKLGAWNLSEVYKECIVIGNIYQHPELLKK